LASISATGGGTIATFQYDAFGRRIKNSVGNGVLYDGPNDVQELSGSTPVANMLTGGVDQFFSRADSTGAFTPLTDALGSTIALTDSTGAIRTQYTYEPFGNTTVSGPASTNAFQYTGRENDGTGVYFYRARYYSPIYQRFISEDPVGFGGGQANLYGYVFNSPTNFVDPSGYGGCAPSTAGRKGGPPHGLQDPPCPPPPDPQTQIPTWWLQTNVFVSGLAQNAANEFKPGGCFPQFANEFVTGQSEDPDPPGVGPEDVTRSVGQSGAMAYAMSKGLYVPLRSSIYRGILGWTETVSGSVAIAPLDFNLVKAYAHEMQSLGSGGCQ